MRCPECGREVEVAKDNEYYCKECGLVMEKLELKPTWETLKSREANSSWAQNLKATKGSCLEIDKKLVL